MAVENGLAALVQVIIASLIVSSTFCAGAALLVLETKLVLLFTPQKIEGMVAFRHWPSGHSHYALCMKTIGKFPVSFSLHDRGPSKLIQKRGQDDPGIIREHFDPFERFKYSAETDNTGTIEEWQRDVRGGGDSLIPKYALVGEYQVIR
jgi:hypothetical protein